MELKKLKKMFTPQDVYKRQGLKSIYDTAEKYGGTAEITTQENQFTLKVPFPIKQK